MDILVEIRNRMKKFANPARAEFSLRYFKTGPGQYGEREKFLGIAAAPLRNLAREFRDVPLTIVEPLLQSSLHEERSLALLILVLKYHKGDETTRKQIFQFYVKNMSRVNNWDLVDLSAEHITGAYLYDRDRSLLHRLAKSPTLWDRRIAMLSTFHYIKKGEFSETFRIAEFLVNDPEDLIHKAVGWMLREVGKRDLQAEEKFLKKHYRGMPRTMLRYAIEKFPESKRQQYLRNLI